MAEPRLIRAWWGEGPDESAEGLAAHDLDPLLDRLDRLGLERPFLVDLSDEEGNVLTVGVGAEVTVLTYMTGSDDPPYFTSHSNEELVDESMWFDYAGAESEFEPDQLVPREDGRTVVRSFARDGDRSGIDWVEV